MLSMMDILPRPRPLILDVRLSELLPVSPPSVDGSRRPVSAHRGHHGGTKCGLAAHVDVLTANPSHSETERRPDACLRILSKSTTRGSTRIARLGSGVRSVEFDLGERA